MATITKSNSDNFLTWQKVDPPLLLSQLQKYGIDKCDSCRFIYSVTVGALETISLPMISTDDSLYNFTVDFGDGGGEKSVNAYTDTDRENTYTNSGTYTITITGVFEYIKFVDSPASLIEIKQFGNGQIGANSFEFCSNFTTISATDSPSIFGTSLTRLFSSCTKFSGDASMINTDGVTDMTLMFGGCIAFNQPLSFNTIAVTDMTLMFANCSTFNGTLSFNTIAVTSMKQMLLNCAAFDQTLENFNIVALTDAEFMLNGATISTTNYDATLISWNNQTHENNVKVEFGGSTYTSGGAAEAARDGLVSDGWTIVDGGAA